MITVEDMLVATNPKNLWEEVVPLSFVGSYLESNFCLPNFWPTKTSDSYSVPS